MALKAPRLKAQEQEPNIRNSNFEEVCIGFTPEQAMIEASRCIQCPKPRCMNMCPVSVKIPQFVRSVAEGDFAAAAGIIAQDSALPAVCGRVCPQETQCEGSCVLGIKGDALSIGQLERFTADWAREHNVSFTDTAPPNGHKVVVIGSGPAGLACAGTLASMGYTVKIFEALHKAGGVLEYGIPEFRLPKEKVVAHEIDNVRRMGVDIETNVIVGRTVTIDSLMDDDGYEAVFIGSGAGLPNFMGIEGEQLNGVVSANEFLTRANLMKAYKSEADTPIFVGHKVAVVGGGNVAMDAARTALRMGAEVSIIYRRTEAELPARLEEVHHAKEEGILFEFLTNPTRVLGDENGRVRAIECVRMELGEPDHSGRRSPKVVEDSQFEIEMDLVIMSLGTSPNPLITSTTAGLQANRKGCITADEQGGTSREGVFAGGDAVTGAATVILAMGAGRKAAHAIDEFIKNK